MKVYHFRAQDGAYLSSSIVPDKAPLPPHSTSTVPPEASGYWPFMGPGMRWELLEAPDGLPELDPAFLFAEQAQFARSERDRLLKETVDMINPLMWETMSEERRQVFRDYRQALLDVPQQADFPHNIAWPTQPNVWFPTSTE